MVRTARSKRRAIVAGAPTVEHTVSYEQALKMAHSRKYRYRYIFAGTWCPLKINDLHGSTSKLGYIATAAVQVTLPSLVSFLRNAFPAHVRDKINVLVVESDGFIFVGRSP